MRDIEWKYGVLWACAGQSSQPITREYFMARSGLNDKSIDIIAKHWHIIFK